MSYTYQEKIGSYPLYHSLYDSYYLCTMIDPDFAIHQSVTRMWGQIAQTLLEKPILPFDITNYPEQLEKSLKILKTNYQSKLEANNATFRFFEAAVNKFARAATNYNETILQNTKYLNAFQIRKINDQLMQIERAFIDHRGLLGQANYNHIVFSPSSRNSYAAANFPGLADLMESVGNQTESQNPELWSQIKEHLALIAFFIEAAADSLSDGL